VYNTYRKIVNLKQKHRGDKLENWPYVEYFPSEPWQLVETAHGNLFLPGERIFLSHPSAGFLLVRGS
jgi:hypothetical protein